MVYSGEQFIRFGKKVVDQAIGVCCAPCLIFEHGRLLLPCWACRATQVLFCNVCCLSAAHDDVGQADDAGAYCSTWRHRVYLRMHLSGAGSGHCANWFVHEGIGLARFTLENTVHSILNEHAFVLYCFLFWRVGMIVVPVFGREEPAARLIARQRKGP